MRIRPQGNPIFIIGHEFAVYLTRAVKAVSVKPPLTHIPNCMVRYVPKNKRATLSYTDGTVNVVVFFEHAWLVNNVQMLVRQQGVRKPGEEITFTARPKIISHS